MKLIAIIGADGSGKTTQAKLLVSRMNSEGLHAKYARPTLSLLNPWKAKIQITDSMSPRLQRIRIDERESTSESAPRFLQAIGFFYAVFAYFKVRISNRATDFVICDRYFYQYFYDLFGEDAIKLLRIFPRPDYVIWLDMDLTQLRGRHTEWKSFESRGDYLEKVVAFYGRISTALQFRRVSVLDEPDLTANAIWNTLAEEVTRCRPVT